MGRSPRLTWRAHAVAHGYVSRKTRSGQALPRRFSITSVWSRNFSATWTHSTVWTNSPRSSSVWTSSRAALVQAEVASTVHRFDDARGHLARAERMGAAREAIERHTLAIDQACGVELDHVLAARRRIATASGRLEDLVPLGAVLVDLECFVEADAVYRQGFYSVLRHLAVSAGVGLLSARHAVGRTGARP